MNVFPNLRFFGGPTLPHILQAEAAECGLASIAMVCGFHGLKIDLPTLRRRFSISLKGSTLKSLLAISVDLNLSTRPLKLPLEKLSSLATPCILHWDMNHFVVLASCDGKHATIHDPAIGLRKLPMSEVSKHFTGVALELTPTSAFAPKNDTIQFSILSLMGKVSGLGSGLGQLFLFGLCIQIIALALPFYVQWVVDDAIVSHDQDLLTVLGLGFVGLAVVQSIITAFRSWVAAALSASLNFQWLNNVFSHLLRLPLSFFEKRNIADISSRFSSVDTIQRTLTTQFVEAIIDGLLVLATAAIMLLYSPMIAAISFFAVFLYFVFRWILFAPLREANSERLLFAAKQSNHFMETIRGAQAIRLFGRSFERKASWLNALVDQINADLRISRISILFQSANSMLFSVERIIVIWFCASLVLQNQFSVGMLIAFLSYKEQFSTRMAALIDKTFEFRMMRLHGERLADIVMSPAEPAADITPLQSSLTPTEDTADLRMSSLRFRYADAEPEILQGLDLAIPKGQCIAITGPSGCGKTTLVKLLLGLLEPTGGDIHFRGVRLDPHALASYRSHVGAVMQDDTLFSASIADNVCFFDPTPDFDLIAAVCQQAAVLQDIQAMPMGFNTLVNEFGAGLSGGQKQRILLARALYRKPDVLVLDEATSHLDVFNEKSVNQAIAAMKLTRIIIAHRPETIAMADRVVVLHQGVIVQDRMRPQQPQPQTPSQS